MRNSFLITSLLIISATTLLPEKVSAQAVGFFSCVDDSGNAGLCNGEIPEALLVPDREYTRVPGERECGSASMSWSENGYSEVPGIRWAILHTYCKNGREITIWTDFEGSFFGGSARANTNGRKVIDSKSVQHTELNGDQNISGMLHANAYIDYRFEAIGDNDGTGFINDSFFNLEKGDLFLIASRGTHIEIKQISYNLANISSEDIKLLAVQHSEIRLFFEQFHE